MQIKLKKKKKKIFISFGGYDHRRLCEKVLKKINFNKFSNYSFLIICGDDAYKKRLELIKKEKKITNLIIFSRTKNFLEHLSESKVSITSGGLTLFESIRLKNKCLAIPQYKHQSYNIEKLTKLGLTKKINLMSNINDILEETLNKNFKSSLIDSNGMQRVIKLFKNRNLL